MRTQLKVDVILEKELNRKWNNGVKIFYENRTPKNPPHEYLNFMSFLGSSQNVSIGNGAKKRNFRTIIGEIRTEKGIGKGRATVLAQDFADIFENKTLDSYILIFTANQSEANTESHYGINVSISYWWDSK